MYRQVVALSTICAQEAALTRSAPEGGGTYDEAREEVGNDTDEPIRPDVEVDPVLDPGAAIPRCTEGVRMVKALHRSRDGLVDDPRWRLVLEEAHQPQPAERADAIGELDDGPRLRRERRHADGSNAHRRRHETREVGRIVEEGEDLLNRRGDPGPRVDARHQTPNGLTVLGEVPWRMAFVSVYRSRASSDC